MFSKQYDKVSCVLGHLATCLALTSGLQPSANGMLTEGTMAPGGLT